MKKMTPDSSYGSRSNGGPVPSTVRRSCSVSSSYGGTGGAVRMVGGQLINSKIFGGSLDSLNRAATGLGMGRVPTVWPPLRSVTVNKKLLSPLNVNIEPDIQDIKLHEKEQIKTLNNRFASFIEKVCFLEQENKRLETTWSVLQQNTFSRSKITSMFENHIAELRRYLDGLDNEKRHVECELSNVSSLVEDFKIKYEHELNKRNECENNFVLLKKDADQGYVDTTKLETSLKSLTKEIKFLIQIYEQELMELKQVTGGTSVVVEMDNSRVLDMDAIVADVQAEYEEFANIKRVEVEKWYKQKYEELRVTATQQSENLRSTKAEIADFNRKILRLQSETDVIMGQRANQDLQIKEAEEQGEKAVKEAKLHVQELEEALQSAKREFARHVRGYQSLMNIKLALDMEIATYKKLLEGEERSVNVVHSVTMSTHSSDTSRRSAVKDTTGSSQGWN